jgi:hypothetical protein
MLPNQASSSASNASSETKSLAQNPGTYVSRLARLLGGRLGLGPVAGEVEALVVHAAPHVNKVWGRVDGPLLGRGERRQPGGDGVVAARLDLHVVRRVGVDQVDACPAEKAVHVFGLASVAAEQAVVVEDPQIARLGDGRVRRGRHVVRVEAEQAEVVVDRTRGFTSPDSPIGSTAAL